MMAPVTVRITPHVCRLLDGPLYLATLALWLKGGAYPPSGQWQTRMVWLDQDMVPTSWLYAEWVRLEVVP